MTITKQKDKYCSSGEENEIFNWIYVAFFILQISDHSVRLYTFESVSVYLFESMKLYLFSLCVCVCIYIYIYIYISICTYRIYTIYAYIHVYVYKCIYFEYVCI